MSINERTAPTAPVRTTVVHRKHRGPGQWWRSAVICDVPGAVDSQQLADVEQLADRLTAIGLTAVSLFIGDPLLVRSTVLADFISVMHQRDLKVIIRLRGARIPTSDPATLDLEDGITTLIGKVRALVAAGVDGVDLGLIEAPVAAATEADPGDIQHRFCQFVRVLRREFGDGDSAPILTAEVPSADPTEALEHFGHNTFHHLRDGALSSSTWNAQSLAEAITTSYEVRERTGREPSWVWSGLHLADTPAEVIRAAHPAGHLSFADPTWESGASQSRRDAMALLACALPGSVHVTLGDIGARIVIDQRVRRQWSEDSTLDRRLELARRILDVRKERNMGLSSLSTVEGLAWVRAGVTVLMVSGVMVVVNTSPAPIEVPGEHHLLVASTGEDGTMVTPGQSFALAGESCAWFVTARIRAEEGNFGEE